MKLEDIQREKLKTKTIKSTDGTFHQLKVVGAFTQRTQNQVLTDLLKEEMERLNLKV